MEHPDSDSLGEGRGRILITGAGGQLGHALARVFPDADARTRAEYDVTAPPELGYTPDLVLHAAAWTNVDGAESDPEGAELVNVVGTRNVAALGAPVVHFSTDYVFDGTKHDPYVESDPTNPLSVYGRTKLDAEAEVCDGWIVRTAWLYGEEGSNFVKTMLRLGRERDEVRVVSDQFGSPTYCGHLAAAVPALLERPYGVWHVVNAGKCSRAELAEAIFEDAGIDCRVIPIPGSELTAPAERPAYSVLASEHADPVLLPHWRDGLRDCLANLG